MPDIELSCKECGKKFKVSEFVTTGSIACPSCGENVSIPKHGSEETRVRREAKKTLRLKEVVDLTPEERGEIPPEEWSFSKRLDDSQQEAPKEKKTHVIASWAIFLVLGGIMGALKYGHVLQSDLSLFWEYCPYIVILFNLVVVLRAFTDDIFQGLLCLLVPFYWLYYLFVVSDDFYVRALCAGMLVGIAQDSALFFADVSKDVYTTVYNFIMSGGGDVRWQ